MNDPFGGGGDRRARLRQRLLAIDGWIDTTIHESGHAAIEAYERLCNFMRRFKAEGLARVF